MPVDGLDRLRPRSLKREGEVPRQLSLPSKGPALHARSLAFSLLSSPLTFPLSLSLSLSLSFLPFIPVPFSSPLLHLRILCKTFVNQRRNRGNIGRCEMERKGKPPRHDQPSFSSTLLDAIYRSIDESDGTGTGTGTETEKRAPKQSDRFCYKLDSWKSSGSLNHHRSSAKTKPAAPGRNRSGAWAHSTSSSSDCSSYGGFSSSEAESVRLKPIRTASRPDPVQYHFPVQSTASNTTENMKKSSSIKSRIKEFRKTKQQLPASPGARITSLLNAIFSKKTTSSETAAKGGGHAPEVGSTCSSASSYTRSCLSKTPSTVKRSVRFCPVSVVVGEEDCGDRRREAEGKKRVEEILRGLEREEEEEEDSSDASSDLFELEDLTVGIERRFRDELPVYGTTSLGMNKGISHGLCRPVI